MEPYGSTKNNPKRICVRNQNLYGTFFPSFFPPRDCNYDPKSYHSRKYTHDYTSNYFFPHRIFGIYFGVYLKWDLRNDINTYNIFTAISRNHHKKWVNKINQNTPPNSLYIRMPKVYKYRCILPHKIISGVLKFPLHKIYFGRICNLFEIWKNKKVTKVTFSDWMIWISLCFIISIKVCPTKHISGF